MAEGDGCLVVKINPAIRRLGFYLIGFVVCVAVPAVITGLAPVSRVSFERHGDRVSARAHILLFLLVPFRPKAIDRVIEIDEETYPSTAAFSSPAM